MFLFKKNYISLLLISFLFSACATKEYANNSRIAVVSKTEIDMVKKTEVSNISGLDKINNEKKEIILLTSFEKIKLKLFGNEVEKIKAYKTFIITNKVEYETLYLPIELPNYSKIYFVKNENGKVDEIEFLGVQKDR